MNEEVEEEEFDEEVLEMLQAIDDEEYREYIRKKLRKGETFFFDNECHCGYCRECLE